MDLDVERLRHAAGQSIGASDEQIERGLELHGRLFTCDLFGFLPRTLSKPGYERLLEIIAEERGHAATQRAWEETLMFSHVYDDESRARFGRVLETVGLNCTVATIGSECTLHHSVHRISMHQQVFDHLQEFLYKVVRVADIEAANAAGKLAVVCSANAAPANTGLVDHAEAHEWIDILYQFGIRVMHLTYNTRTWIGDGCMETADAGLSAHGKDVVRHLNEVGIVVDTPHTGRQTTLDAARLSSAPIMATHTCCEGVFDHPRAKSDEELKAIAESGGLVGMCMISRFLGGDGSLKQLLRHIEYAVDLLGPDHVGIGTDTVYAGPHPADNVRAVPGFPHRSGEELPASWWGDRQDAARRLPSIPQHDSIAWLNWPMFTVGLVTLGYSDEDIAKILGGNLLRVLAEVERVGRGRR